MLIPLLGLGDDQPPMTLGNEPRLSRPDIAPASDAGEKAMKLFRLPEGFEASLWAAEPMLANPVAIQFDERGRLFVSETYRYGSSVLDIRRYLSMLEDDLASRNVDDRLRVIERQFGEKGLRDLAIEGEVLRLLEDSDHDGVADRSTIYADGFNSPLDGIASGSLPRNGKVWFTNIPTLWQFEGENRAEIRRPLSNGYGVHFGYTGHDLHGLAWGPDGKLYFSIGDRGAHAKAVDGSIASTPDAGAVFRCNPDGTRLEIVHVGLRNPQDLLFTENGDLFTGDNDSDQGDQERLVQIVEGGDSGWRIGYQFAPLGDAGPWNSERMWWPRNEDQPAFMLPPICNIEDGPSGVAYYPGTGLAPGYEGTIFITHFKGAIASSGIQTYNLRPEGASYAVADSKTFLSGALPTDTKFGPDGRLYYSDWVEAWPKSKRGRIYALVHPDHLDDPLTQETERLINAGMAGRSDDELAGLLAHADRRVRLEAQFTLAERGASSAPHFEAVATDGDAAPLARLHALWGLGQLAGFNVAGALDEVGPLLGDSDPEVRAQTARILGDHGVTKATGDLIQCLSDQSSRVRFFAAQSLGKIGDPYAAPALIQALAENDDRDAYLRHALVMGLTGTRNDPVLDKAGASESRAVRLGVLLAFRKLGDPRIARFLRDPDPFLVAEAARAINDRPINRALPELASLIHEVDAEESVTLRALNATFRLGRKEDAAALAAFAARDDAEDTLRIEAFRFLREWPKPPDRDRIVGIYRPIESGVHDPDDARRALAGIFPDLLETATPPNVQEAAFAAARSLKLKTVSDALVAAVLDNSKSGSTRAAALAALDQFDDPRIQELITAVAQTDDPDLSRAALPVAARHSPDRVASVIESISSTGSWQDQRVAFAALGELDHQDADKITIELLGRLEAGKIWPAAHLELLEAAEKRTSAAVQNRLKQLQAKLAAADDPIKPYEFALAGGSRWRGGVVFNSHPVMACQRCHLVGGQGGEAGPDLSAIAMTKTPHELLEAVIKPNATIAEGYETVVVTLQSGGIEAGTIADEDDEHLTLHLADGTLKRIAQSEIAKRDSGPSSMPEIYGAVLSRQDLRDLIAYLTSLRLEASSTPGPRALAKTPVADGSQGHGEG